MKKVLLLVVVSLFLCLGISSTVVAQLTCSDSMLGITTCNGSNGTYTGSTNMLGTTTWNGP